MVSLAKLSRVPQERDQNTRNLNLNLRSWVEATRSNQSAAMKAELKVLHVHDQTGRLTPGSGVGVLS